MSARKTGLRRLLLSDFRSYPALDLPVEADLIVVSGENGSGKTNLMEAISMFAQGRGLRRAELGDCARQPGSGGFAVSIEVEGAGGRVRYGTGLEAGEAGPVRRYRVDREPVGSGRAFAEALRLVWLTPAMDSLFVGSPGERRRFLDRLVLAVDADHGSRVMGLERALRQRNRVLEDGARADPLWLDAIEREVAELGVAVAAARVETVSRLAAFIAPGGDTAFPWAQVEVVGDVEALCRDMTAIEAEDLYRARLKAQRPQDAAAGRTLIGPQVSDLAVRHGPKDMPAALCSTGEQKALLVGLILAHARLIADFSGIAPVLLLDEVAAHFDAARREALFAELARLPGQVWMTGADLSVFDPIAEAQRLRVVPGHVERLPST